MDRHELLLPAELPAGTYPIEVGLYNPRAEGKRLNVLDAAGKPRGHRVEIGEVRVRH